ncbi:phosphatase PAP2 family protein [Cohnella candidum]|uniref:Phosphatase PAP2 family protein n=1 Tax=Cohnella candidum TaxID=2674991 RepID=A0A3G3JV54_9BACL|nr:phosphatase PAP2 family protein [Cohnella candidum]AYQ71389.1 phosphatase PAP2 family protein [Cohnella candidum]
MRRLKAVLFTLEFHEWLCILMVMFLIVLYQTGLSGWGIGYSIAHIWEEGSPITKLFFLLLILLGIVTRFLTAGPIKEFGSFLFRMMGAFMVMLFCFESVIYFIEERNLPLLDVRLLQWDAWLFGGKQPAEWLEPITTPFLTYILSTVYLLWFPMVYGTVMLMYIKGKKAVVEYVCFALMTYYIGYLIYLIVPGIGPLYVYDFSTPIGGLTAMMTEGKLIQPAADVFPSLHTGISVVMLIQVWRRYRIWTWVYGPLTVLIICSTIYLRIHYAVDVFAGIILSIAIAYLCPFVLRKWEDGRSKISMPMSTILESEHSERLQTMEV